MQAGVMHPLPCIRFSILADVQIIKILLMDIGSFLNHFQLTAWQESEELEWKLSTRESKDITQSVTAFANTRGGVLVCGVKDNGEIVGQDISDATIREMTQTILANTQERLYPSIERFTLEGKGVLVFSISASPLRPHVAYGRPYLRVGSSNVVMDQSEYHRLLGAKSNGGGADRDICEDASLEDINIDKLRRFVNLANERRNLNVPLFAEPLEILESLELVRGGLLTKGAILLFGKEPTKWIPSAELRAAQFKDDTRDIFLSQDVFRGDLFDQFESAIQFVKKCLPLQIDTSKVGNRASLKIPLTVVQELVANALVHRDYRDAASSYLNIIAEDSFEISNPGTLPAPRVTPETMLLPHPSIPINRRIARVFFLAGIIEQWGEGARRAARALKERALPEPVWSSERGTVSVFVHL
jgi:ATP-dependent DNA helicase RecG